MFNSKVQLLGNSGIFCEIIASTQFFMKSQQLVCYDMYRNLSLSVAFQINSGLDTIKPK